MSRAPVSGVPANGRHAIKGAASGPLVPLSMAILFDMLSPGRRKGINLAMGACGLPGISTGPPIGGWLSEFQGWHSIFYFSMPLVAFSFVLVALFLPEKKAEQKPFFGFATFTLGIIGLQMLPDLAAML